VLIYKFLRNVKNKQTLLTKTKRGKQKLILIQRNK